MDPVYGLLLLAIMVIAFFAARRAAERSRRSLDKYRQRRRQHTPEMPMTNTGSPRSDMRSFDDPTTVMDALQQKSRPWEGDIRSSDQPDSGAREKK